MADELSILHEWLYGTLSSDAQLLALLANPPAGMPGESIYRGSVPQEVEVTEEPVVLIQHLPAREDADFITINGTRIWTRGTFRIFATANLRDSDALGPVADRIDELLNRAQGTTGVGRVVYVLRKGTYDLPVVEAGKEYQRRGANFEWAVRNGLN